MSRATHKLDYQHVRIEDAHGMLVKEVRYQLHLYRHPDGSEFQPTGEFRVPIHGEYWTTPKETKIYGPYEEGTTSLYNTTEHGYNRVILTRVKEAVDPFFDGATRIADTRLLRTDYFIMRCRACSCGEDGYREEPVLYRRGTNNHLYVFHHSNNSPIADIDLRNEVVNWHVDREDVAMVLDTCVEFGNDDIPF